MMLTRTRKSLSYLQREAAARDLADARRADREDPEKALIRRIRAEQVAGYDAGQEAHRVYAAENNAIPLPVGLAGGVAHPQKVARLAEILAAEGWGADPREPITPTRTVDAIKADLCAESLARQRAAQAELDAIKRGEAA